MLYSAAVDDVPLAALKAGVAHAMRTRAFFPKPAELRADVDAALEQQRDRARRDAQDADRRLRLAPVVRPVGRMSKLSVLAQFGGFTALELCECPECVLAHPQGPPRFVPDGLHPVPVCGRCEDTGWMRTHERTDVAQPAYARCLCGSSNPNLIDGTKPHTIEIGRWIHGDELVHWEQSKLAFEQALRRVGQAVPA